MLYYSHHKVARAAHGVGGTPESVARGGLQHDTLHADTTAWQLAVSLQH